jgi:hypothetical protein
MLATTDAGNVSRRRSVESNVKFFERELKEMQKRWG